jgi:hypothetical protein
LAQKSDGHLYIGTTHNCVLEGSMQRKLNLLIWGHRYRLDALAVHPDDIAFVTAGHDKVRFLYNKRVRPTENEPQQQGISYLERERDGVRERERGME